MSAQSPDLGRAFLTPVFATLVVVNVLHLVEGKDSLLAMLGTAAALAFYAVLAYMYLRRGKATGTNRKAGVWIVAGIATLSPFFIPLVGLGGAGEAAKIGGAVLVVVGIGLSTWALLHLRTNISVVPQSRKLVTTGPYRLFRHPLYVFEYITAVGLVALSGGGWAWLLVVALGILQVLRARWEEELLLTQIPDYAAYSSTTRGFS